MSIIQHFHRCHSAGVDKVVRRQQTESYRPETDQGDQFGFSPLCLSKCVFSNVSFLHCVLKAVA